jgi:hypothetical protein
MVVSITRLEGALAIMGFVIIVKLLYVQDSSK